MPASSLFRLSIALLAFGWAGFAHAKDAGSVIRSGSAQVRHDLLEFLEAEEHAPEVSIKMPPLSAFTFDANRYPGAMRTELSSRMEPPFLGRVAVTVTLFAGEHLIKRAIVSPYLRVNEKVVVAARDLRRGHIVSKRDLEIVERDQARLRQGYFGQMEDLIGTRLTRSLRRGGVIVASATEQVPVVERGDRVVVVLESGAMKLQSIGRAQEDGGIGEWIRVQNLDSKKELSGRLDQVGRVHVTF